MPAAPALHQVKHRLKNSRVTNMECSILKCNIGRDKCLKKEIWRLRLNWMFLFSLGGLYAVSYTSLSSSFHQFVTNPSVDQLNGTNSTMEIGLGQTESFYSVLISLFNLGALVGAVLCGFLVKVLPYWYLIMFSLFAHTIGYVLYAVTSIGWLIMISKFLSGFFIGAELTLALSYFAESSIEYHRLRLEVDAKKESSSQQFRNMLFALHNVGINIGYIFGPGFAVILAQFKVNQFRSIAWYNVALGVAAMFLQLAMFHGESTFKKVSKQRLSLFCSKDFKFFNPSEFLILAFLIVLRGVLSFRFGAYETVYNPVLSDYYGFNEIYSSYFFFALTLAQIFGTLLLIFFQNIKIKSQTIAIIGLLMTIGSCVLMADWQSIPYDECTEYSPFHNPGLVDNYNIMLEPRKELFKRTHCDQLTDISSNILMSFELISRSKVTLLSGYTIETQVIDGTKFDCQRTDVCSLCSQHYSDGKPVCLQFGAHVNAEGCWTQIDGVHLYDNALNSNVSESFLCSSTRSNLSFCIFLRTIPLVQLQSLKHLKPDVYNAAMNMCLTANGTRNNCYWNPQSIITGKHCEDCQPICRSRSHSLTFVQFVLGSALLLVSIPVAWVPVAALISNRVSTAAQGIVMGLMVALTAIGRSVSPIWLDAAYEGMEKRTFLAMTLLAVTHLPFLIGTILLFRKLQNASVYTNRYSKLVPDQSDTD